MSTPSAGDLVRIEFAATLDSSGSLFETTDPKIAQAGGIYSEQMLYGPRLAIFGRGFMIPGLEEGLVQMKAGQSAKIHVPYAKAFGARLPELVRVMSQKELARAGVQPRPGMLLNIDGVQARIKSVSPGRVVLDFNHPLAQEDVTYHLTLLEVISDPAAKVKALGGEFKVSLAIAKNAAGQDEIVIPKLLEAGRARALAAMLNAALGEKFAVKIQS